MKRIIFSILLVMLLFLLAGCEHEHQYEQEIIHPTCTQEGYIKSYCVCGKEIIEVFKEKVDHKYDSWEIIEEPTEYNEGLQVRACIFCDNIETQKIPMLEHTHNYEISIVEPTCTEIGYTEYQCFCGYKYRENERILEHKEYIIPGKSATCFEDGYTESIICLTCNEILKAQITIEAIGEHQYGEWVIVLEQTSNSNGIRKRQCLKCDYEIIESIMQDSHIHNYVEQIVEPTCIEVGYTKFICDSDECNHQYFDNYKAALGHIEENLKGVAPTCTRTGLTDGKICSRCEEILIEQTTISMLDHTEEIIKGYGATCTESGLTDGKICTSCQIVTVAPMIILPLGHIEKIVEGYEATCSKDGLSDGYKCIRCNTYTKEQEVIASLGHKYGSWTVVSEPTLSKAGTQEKECTMCHSKVTEDIPVRVDEFIYNLVYSDLKQEYDTFVGYIDNSEETEEYQVYGITYVDYQNGYIDNQGKTYFSAGFISFADQEVLEEDIIPLGNEIISLEEERSDLFSYVYSYSTEDVHKHCVIDGKYIKYDIVNGVLNYNEEIYTEGMNVDFSRGNIYNYDTKEYVYIVEELDYIPITGVSLIGETTYKDVIEEANKILLTQKNNLTYSELKSFVSQSQEALYSYLLGLQEETFLGIPVAELVNVVKDLDPMQHLRIGVDENGITTFELIEVVKLPTLSEKICASLIGALGVVGGIVCTAMGHPVIGGIIVGATMEIFSQVVISNTPMSDIQWAQVAVATVAGAIAGGVSSAIGGITVSSAGQLLMREVADTLCDSIIGGGEFFVNALIAGKSFEEACKSFGYGVVTGAILSGVFKVGIATVKGGSKLIKKITTNTVTDINGKTITKLSNEVTEEGFSELQEKTLEKYTLIDSKKSIAGVFQYFDGEGKLYRIGDELVSNNQYIKNGYNYFTDHNGRIIKVKGELYLNNSSRKTIKDSMSKVGKGDQLLTDHRGHIIADIFGGSEGLENIVAQNASLNQKEYRNLEKIWQQALSDGKQVFVDIELVYTGNSFRPTAFEIEYTIDGIVKYISFRN